MRPLEVSLFISNLLSFFSLAISSIHANYWMQFTIPLTAIICTTQILVEGSRWQMIPSYLLTIAFFLIWLLGVILQIPSSVNRLVFDISVGIGVLVLVVAFILPIVLPVFAFPKPTGQYGIGTTTYHWVDTSRPELFTVETNDHRELLAQVWYPIDAEFSGAHAPYIQDADIVTPTLAKLFHLPEFIFTHLRYVTTHAIESAPVAEEQTRYPVLIFLSGANGFRSINTFQIEELVSHGYIVVGLDQPGAVAMVQLPDGRQITGLRRDRIHTLIMQSVDPQVDAPTLYGAPQPDGIIPYFAEDVSFTLDELTKTNADDPQGILTGRLDLDHTGIFGISLGGTVTPQACLQDIRLKACLIMDAPIPLDVVKEGLKQPCMVITRDADTMRHERERAGGWTEYDIDQHQTTMRAVYERTPNGYFIRIPNIFHVNFTDFPYWSPITSQLGLVGEIDKQRGFDIVNAYTVAFFDQYLKHQPSRLLDGSATQYPEVIFETHHSS